MTTGQLQHFPTLDITSSPVNTTSSDTCNFVAVHNTFESRCQQRYICLTPCILYFYVTENEYFHQKSSSSRWNWIGWFVSLFFHILSKPSAAEWWVVFLYPEIGFGNTHLQCVYYLRYPVYCFIHSEISVWFNNTHITPNKPPPGVFICLHRKQECILYTSNGVYLV